MNDSLTQKLLIIGTIPPPIGGVTVYTSRLLSYLKKSDISYGFIDIKRNKITEIFAAIKKSRIIHIHSSNVLFKLLSAIFFTIIGKKVFITYHGNINRFGRIKNFLDRLSIRFSERPIVINNKSYEIAKKINTKTVFTSAFIPPDFITQLDPEVESQISYIRAKCDTVFCTNAYNVSYDRDNREIYQITSLVKLFNQMTDKGLIISDPSANYAKLLKQKGISVNSNILLLSFNHDFNAVLIKSDCLVRYTTTDGDSLSVKEALYLGKAVIATSVVDRPQQVILVDNIDTLKETILSFKIKQHKIFFKENGFNQMYDLYKAYML